MICSTSAIHNTHVLFIPFGHLPWCCRSILKLQCTSIGAPGVECLKVWSGMSIMTSLVA